MKKYKDKLLTDIGRNLYITLSGLPYIRNGITCSDTFGINERWRNFPTRFLSLANKFFSISTRTEEDNQSISIEFTISPTIDWLTFTRFYKSTIVKASPITITRMKVHNLKGIIQGFVKPIISENLFTKEELSSYAIYFANEKENLKQSSKVYEDLNRFTSNLLHMSTKEVKKHRRSYFAKRYRERKKQREKIL